MKVAQGEWTGLKKTFKNNLKSCWQDKMSLIWYTGCFETAIMNLDNLRLNSTHNPENSTYFAYFS